MVCPSGPCVKYVFLVDSKCIFAPLNLMAFNIIILRDNFDGKKVVKLEYEAYEPMAIKELKR